MTKKEPLKFKLTEEQLCELKEKQKAINGLRIQSFDLAKGIGQLDMEMWDKVREFAPPEGKESRYRVNWQTGEIVEVRDC